MNQSLQSLIELCPPPVDPVAPGSMDTWPEVEAIMETQRPTDFKEYILAFGAGEWADFFGMTNPFCDWKHPRTTKSWKAWPKSRFDGFEDFRQKYPNDFAPFPLHPKPGGLLAFGFNDNGGTICWQTRNEPDSWPVVCLDEDLSEEYDAYDMNLTGFLEALLSEKISPKTFPGNFFPITEPAFRPYATQ